MTSLHSLGFSMTKRTVPAESRTMGLSALTEEDGISEVRLHAGTCASWRQGAWSWPAMAAPLGSCEAASETIDRSAARASSS